MAIPSTDMVLPPLLRLPVELHLSLIDLLDTNDDPLALICLRIANRYFHSATPAANHATLLKLETSEVVRQNHLYACKHCLRLRPASTFADSMLKGEPGLNSL